MLNVKHLSYQKDNKKILNDLSFERPLGTLTTLLGPSGGGKTTLLRCLAKLEPCKGDIFFQKKPLESIKDGQIGFVFQNFHLFPHLTVLENLTLAPTCLGRENPKLQAMSLLTQFGIGSLSSSLPRQISGGQRQRVAIARTLMLNPPLILFDEPTSALDPQMVQDVAEILISLKDQTRCILVVTHELRLARLISDHVLFLDHGRLLDDKDAKHFFEGNGVSVAAEPFLNQG